jgi:hypothetical protein
MTEPIDMLERDEKAADAKALLDNLLLQEIFRRLEEEATTQMIESGPMSPEAVSAHFRILAIRSLQADLVRFVDDPKMLRAAQERRRRFSQ